MEYIQFWPLVEIIGRTNSYLYNKPSILIGRKEQSIRHNIWILLFGQSILYFTLSFQIILTQRFIFYLFNTIEWIRYNEASGVPSLNASTIENIEIQCPSFLEQTAIATILTDMDVEITALEQRRDKTRALKQGMMQELLTGKTRLV